MATVNSASNVGNQIANSSSRLADNEQTFLKLLTSQLKNQDPLSPMDSSQFTQQIVQMTGVEQQLLTNSLLTTLIGMNDGGLSSAVGMIGKSITAENTSSTLADGKAEWNYNLDRGAAKLKLEVVNAAGTTVFTKESTNAPGGDQTFTWDGKDAKGATLPNGTYKLKVTALGTGGETIASTASVSGVVTAIETLNGETVLSVGGLKIPLSSVTKVKTV